MFNFNTYIAKLGRLLIALVLMFSFAQFTVAAEPFTGAITELNKVNPSGTIVKASLTDILGTWITRLIAVVGIIALLYTVYAGYIYMTSEGSDDVAKAKKTLLYLVIGILILMSAYAITRFVFNLLIPATRT